MCIKKSCRLSELEVENATQVIGITKLKSFHILYQTAVAS